MTEVQSREVEAMVRHLRDEPNDEATRLILADLLDEAGAAKVSQHGLPPNFVSFWAKHVSKSPTTSYYRRGKRSGHVVAREVEYVVNSWWRKEKKHVGSPWDHWGRAAVGPWDCLVTEPYARVEDAHDLMRPVAALLPGTVHAFQRNGWHCDGHTVRGILFPPSLMSGWKS